MEKKILTIVHCNFYNLKNFKERKISIYNHISYKNAKNIEEGFGNTMTFKTFCIAYFGDIFLTTVF